MNLKNQKCPNPNCFCFGIIVQRNVVIYSKKYRRFQCKTCKKTWVEHRNERHFGLKFSPEIIERAVNSIERGVSIRKVAQGMEISPSTIQRWKKLYL